MKFRHNNAINSDPKKLRCAPLFVSGYGRRSAHIVYLGGSNVFLGGLSYGRYIQGMGSKRFIWFHCT